MLKHFVIFAALFLLASCVTPDDKRSQDYDLHEVRTQFFSLFNQRTYPQNLSNNWKGDWLFRRERLILIDKELGELKPNIIILQDVMERDGNAFEADRSILASNALKSYRWSLTPIEHYQDTGEIESLAIAVSTPLTPEPTTTANLFRVGLSLFSFESVKVENQNIAILNVKMSENITVEEFDRLLHLVELRLNDESLCPERFIVAVYAPVEVRDRLLENTNRLGLQDVAKGFCNMESQCYTAHARNGIFFLARGETPPSRSDFIFVPKSAKISMSTPTFGQAQKIPTDHFKSFGLKDLWPSERSGWFSSLRFARCVDSFNRP